MYIFVKGMFVWCSRPKICLLSLSKSHSAQINPIYDKMPQEGWATNAPYVWCDPRNPYVGRPVEEPKGAPKMATRARWQSSAAKTGTCNNYQRREYG